jgi:predicted MPP superfamily phosphohydrolase
VDICLAGNTHGGQVCLPFVGAITGSSNDRKYLAGLYRVDQTWLYVNRGIGMSDAGPAIRFGARPEVTVIEISPGR